jgi:hypothetical protein
MLILIAATRAGGWAETAFGSESSGSFVLGDIFLLLPTSFFIAGWPVFFCARCYIIGFNQSLPYFAGQMP